MIWIVIYLTGYLVAVPFMARLWVDIFRDISSGIDELDRGDYAAAAICGILTAPFWPLALPIAPLAWWLNNTDRRNR